MWTCTVMVHTYPARPFARLSPCETGPSIHYPLRIGNGTCTVNGTVVLELWDLQPDAFDSKLRTERVLLENFHRKWNPRGLYASFGQECLTPLRPTS
jgi:hypothetical protein